MVELKEGAKSLETQLAVRKWHIKKTIPIQWIRFEKIRELLNRISTFFLLTDSIYVMRMRCMDPICIIDLCAASTYSQEMAIHSHILATIYMSRHIWMET